MNSDVASIESEIQKIEQAIRVLDDERLEKYDQLANLRADLSRLLVAESHAQINAASE